MKLPFLTLLLVLGTTFCQAQTNPSKPTIGQVLSSEGLPPGTIKVEVVPLNSEWTDSSCQQEMEQIAVKVEQLIAMGSGLINPVRQGDSLNIRILKGMDFTRKDLSENDTLLLKEQLCAFDKTYFTWVRKE